MNTRSFLVTTLVLIMFASAPLAGCLESIGGNSAPTANFSFTPSGTLKAGMSINFDASASSDAEEDDLTYSWDFGDTNDGDGRTISHTYSQAGDYTVKLSVSDGEFEAQEEKTLTIYSADAAEPNAEIFTNKANGCDDEDPPATGTYILVWICDDDLAESEDDWSPETTVTLDASDSTAGSAEAWLVSWKWDLNINVDSDGDGDKSNDVDAEGETHQWTTTAGEWRVQVTVTDDQGMSSTANTWVYVNARATWSDMEIGRNNSADNPRKEFTVDFIYNLEENLKLNNLYARVVYPKEDPGAGFGLELDNEMNLYFFNETDEEVRNSTSADNSERTDSTPVTTESCSDDDYCVIIFSSTGDFRTYLDGKWVIQVKNEAQHNAEIKSVQILLKYK